MNLPSIYLPNFPARSFGSNQMESSGPFGTRRGDLQMAYDLHSRSVYAWSRSPLYHRMLDWSTSPSHSSKGWDSLRGVSCSPSIFGRIQGQNEPM